MFLLTATDNCVSNMPLGRLLCSFAHTAHFTHSLRSALLCSTRFAHPVHVFALSHFAHCLVLMGQLKFMNMCLLLHRDKWEENRLLSSLETRPYTCNEALGGKITVKLPFTFTTGIKLPASEPAGLDLVGLDASARPCWPLRRR